MFWKPLLALLAVAALAMACTDTEHYPITGEECAPEDPVQTITPAECAPA